MKIFALVLALAAVAYGDMSKFSGKHLTAADGDALKTGTWFVKFYAPWCGHCKRMHAAWEQLAVDNADVEGVNVARMDCTDKNNRPVCSEHGVRGFPTVKLIKDGKATKYSGKRTVKECQKWVDSNKSTKEEL
jgi:thioredoxin domain-containing protein 5